MRAQVELLSLDERRKKLQKQLREIDKFSDLGEMLRDGQKEKWKGQLQEIEKGRGQNFFRSTRRCRRGHRSCRVCRTRRGITSRTLAPVKKKCKSSVTKWRKGRHVSRHVSMLCLKSRAIVGGQQMMWKKKSRPCRQARKEEAAVRPSPMGVALIQPC